MRKHHKEDSSVWGSSLRESSVRGSNPRDKFSQGEQPRWEVTFSIDVKGGEIHQMHGERVRCLEREHRGMIPGGVMVTGGA
jgi:hypothetical protein